MKSKKLTTADARRVQIAASVAAGQSIAATARQIGISREWASRIANAPKTQQITAPALRASRKGKSAVTDPVLRGLTAAGQA